MRGGRETASRSRFASRTDGTRRRATVVEPPEVRFAVGPRTVVVIVSTPGMAAGRSCRRELLIARATASRTRRASASVQRSSVDKREAREASAGSLIVELPQERGQSRGRAAGFCRRWGQASRSCGVDRRRWRHDRLRCWCRSGGRLREGGRCGGRQRRERGRRFGLADGNGSWKRRRRRGWSGCWGGSS